MVVYKCLVLEVYGNVFEFSEKIYKGLSIINGYEVDKTMTIEQIHQVDDDTVKLETMFDGTKYLELNGTVVMKGFVCDELEDFEHRFDMLVEALKKTGYEYEDYIVDREGELEAGESRFVLLREYPDGSLEDMDFSDEREELLKLFEGVEL